MSSNSGSSVQGLRLDNIYNSITEFVTNNQALNVLMNQGNNEIPYGFMALATFAAGTFTYVTYQDYSEEIASGVSETIDSIQSSELFSPSDNTDELSLIGDVPLDDKDENMEQEDIIINNEEIPEEEENIPEINKEEPIEQKEDEPGEKYKMGGKSKKRRRNVKKRRKSKRKQ